MSDFLKKKKDIQMKSKMIKNMDDLHFENPSGYDNFLHYSHVFS